MGLPEKGKLTTHVDARMHRIHENVHIYRTYMHEHVPAQLDAYKHVQKGQGHSHTHHIHRETNTYITYSFFTDAKHMHYIM